MIDRRRFIGVLGGATAAMLGDPGATSARSRRVERVGLQLYTVRREMARDFDATLATVAEIGYDEVEFAGYFERTPAQVRAALEKNGLVSPASHIGLNEIQADPSRVLGAAAEIGQRYIVVPSLARQQRDTVEALRRTAAALNEAGRSARAAGLRIGYHNHDAEFAPIDGRRPFDILLEETDPGLVWFEMDLYWITRGGGDPLAYIDRYPGRFALVHVKDMDGTDARGMTEVGTGIIDFAKIFAASSKAGIQHYFVEHDNARDPIASIRTSYANLKAL